jgi:hypothetical protein
MQVTVECYAGHRADQSPRRFELDGRMVEVDEIIDQWQGEDYRYFRLRGADNNHYILRHDETAGQWDLTLYETPRGKTIADQPNAHLQRGKPSGKPH